MPSFIADGERPASLHDALEALQTASETPAKQRSSKVSGIVDAICQHAFAEGLDAETLHHLVHIVTQKTYLDQTSVTTLLKNLYPAQRIPADSVTAIVAALGQGKGKPSAATQNALVRWLTTVYDILEEPKTLSRLYGVLFGMLDMVSIRTSLCHLLSTITRRRHVKPYRIQQLHELTRAVGDEPALQGLLRIYKDYYPEILLGSAAVTRNSFPPRLDPDWQRRILAVQETSASAHDDFPEQHNGFKVLRSGAKRTKVSLIPELHTFHAGKTTVTLEEIDSAEDFVEKLERIELPGQLISFLTDPLLQKYLTLRPSSIASRRIELWLSTYLEDEYKAAAKGVGRSAHLSEILQGLFRHAQYAKSVLPVVSTFLREYLLVWDGGDDDAVLGILAYLPLQPFADVDLYYLGPAERTLAGHDPDAYEKLFYFYAKLLRHWTIQIYLQHRSQDVPAPDSPGQGTILDLADHVAKRATSLLASPGSETHPNIVSAILSFYEVLASFSGAGQACVVLPPAHLTHTLLQSPSSAHFSRLYGILAKDKVAFDLPRSRPLGTYYPKPVTNIYNGYLIDACNLLWRTRAFSTEEENTVASFCKLDVREALRDYLPRQDHDYALAQAFGLSSNPLLASFAANAWQMLEQEVIDDEGFDSSTIARHRGPVAKRSLEVLKANGGVNIELNQYRIAVLNWMQDRGAPGTKQLIYRTMPSVANA